MPRPRPSALLAVGALGLVLASCGTVRVPPGPAAADPTCAEILLAAPPQVLGLDRVETSSQGTAAWGSGEDTIVLRCGVVPPGPTTDICTTLETADGVLTDWIVRELDGSGAAPVGTASDAGGASDAGTASDGGGPERTDQESSGAADDDTVFLYTTYGREPAIDVTVPRSVAPDQPSGAALELAPVIERSTDATAHCVGPGDAG